MVGGEDVEPGVLDEGGHVEPVDHPLQGRANGELRPSPVGSCWLSAAGGEEVEQWSCSVWSSWMVRAMRRGSLRDALVVLPRSSRL